MDYVARTPEQLGQDSKRPPQKTRPDSAGGGQKAGSSKLRWL